MCELFRTFPARAAVCALICVVAVSCVAADATPRTGDVFDEVPVLSVAEVAAAVCASAVDAVADDDGLLYAPCGWGPVEWNEAEQRLVAAGVYIITFVELGGDPDTDVREWTALGVVGERVVTVSQGPDGVVTVAVGHPHPGATHLLVGDRRN